MPTCLSDDSISMRCRKCNYSLWKLNRANCPECGTAFDWRTYRFRPNAIGLACPHCGHLHKDSPPSTATWITCHGCGKSVTAKAMQVVPLTADPRQAEAISEIKNSIT